MNSKYERYSRQILFEPFGEKGQELLKTKKVFIAGAGGLGSVVSYYLTAAGVGTLCICDFDQITLSNLNRQILHSTSRIGMDKVESALHTLSDLNPDVSILTLKERITEDNCTDLIGGYDLIMDCMDNMKTRHILNRGAFKLSIPMIHGGIQGLAGQLTFLNPPQTPCLACIAPEYPDSGKPIPVFGATAGLIGCYQSLEALKYLAGFGEILAGKLVYFDGFYGAMEKFTITKLENCPICGQSRA